MNENLVPSPQADAAPAVPVWLVLVNAQGQYALWPVVQPVPDGWREAGPEGSEEELAGWLDAHWTDMRPAVLRA